MTENFVDIDRYDYGVTLIDLIRARKIIKVNGNYFLLDEFDFKNQTYWIFELCDSNGRLSDNIQYLTFNYGLGDEEQFSPMSWHVHLQTDNVRQRLKVTPYNETRTAKEA